MSAAHKVSFARKVEAVKPLVAIGDSVDLVTDEVAISDGIGDSITGDEPRTIKAKRKKQTLGSISYTGSIARTR